MTTIAYRGGYLVSDSRAYSGERMPIGLKSKLFDLDDGGVIGISTTSPGASERLVKWINAGSDEEKFPLKDIGFTALRISKSGEVFFYHDGQFPSGPLRGDFFAVGSGAEYALGAMEQGASAIDAVHIAIKLDVWSGGDIMVKDIRTPREKRVDEVMQALKAS